MRQGVRQSSALDPANAMPPSVATVFGDFLKDSGDWGVSLGTNAANSSGAVSYAVNSIWTIPSGALFPNNAEGQMQFSAEDGPTFGVATLTCQSTTAGRLDRNQAAFSSNPVTGALTYGQLRVGYGAISMEFRVKGNAAAITENYRMACGIGRFHAIGAPFTQDDAICWRNLGAGRWQAVVSRGQDDGSGSWSVVSHVHPANIDASRWNTFGIEVNDDASMIEFIANGSVVKTFHRSEHALAMPDQTSQLKMNLYCGIMEGTGCTNAGSMEVDYASARIRLARGGR